MAGQLVASARLAEFAEEFGAFLLQREALDELALQRSLRAARQSGERFDRVLIKLGLAPEAELCTYLAGFLDLREFKPADAPLEAVLTDLAPEKFLRANGMIPLAVHDGRLSVAVFDPFDDEAREALAYATGLGNRTPPRQARPCSKRPGRRLWRGQGGAGALDADQRALEASEFDLQRLRDIANEAPVVRRVNQIVADAIEARASDIHIEPTPEGSRSAIASTARCARRMLPPGLKAAVASRIKIMARLDIAERRLPQDGRIKLAVRGVDIDFRVSTLPTVHGESIVLRILDRSRIALDFDALGFEPTTISALRDVMRLPNGIVLVTGPTGSGKTTTLYTALRELNAARRQDLHRRGPDRISARRHQPGPGAAGDRPGLSGDACARSCARIPTSS